MMFSLSSCGSCVSITRCSSLWLAKAMERQVLWPGVQLTNKLWSTRRRPTRNASSIYLLHKHQSNFLVKEFLERTACDNRFFFQLTLSLLPCTVFDQQNFPPTEHQTVCCGLCLSSRSLIALTASGQNRRGLVLPKTCP